MSSNTSASGLEAFVGLVGAAYVLCWGTYAVYRKMISRQKNRWLSLFAGLLVGGLLAICWIALVVIASSPNDWLSLSFVTLTVASAFYATWRYTRVQEPVEVLDPSMLRQAWRWTIQRQRESNQKLAADLRALWAQLKQSAQPKPATAAATTTATMAPVSLPAWYEFDYANEDGELSSRRVWLQAATSSGDRQYLEGVCSTRSAVRTFRVDRVIGSMTRVDDGQPIRASELFARIENQRVVTAPSAPAFVPLSRGSSGRYTAVFFAGFGSAKRSELEELAEAAGWQVRTSITKTVDYVVTGSMVGSGQLAKAGELGIAVLDEEGFRGRV